MSRELSIAEAFRRAAEQNKKDERKDEEDSRKKQESRNRDSNHYGLVASLLAMFS